jgi:hypothetical protein
LRKIQISKAKVDKIAEVHNSLSIEERLFLLELFRKYDGPSFLCPRTVQDVSHIFVPQCIVDKSGFLTLNELQAVSKKWWELVIFKINYVNTTFQAIKDLGYPATEKDIQNALHIADADGETKFWLLWSEESSGQSLTWIIFRWFIWFYSTKAAAQSMRMNFWPLSIIF